MDNQTPYIGKGQTIQSPKVKEDKSF